MISAGAESIVCAVSASAAVEANDRIAQLQVAFPGESTYMVTCVGPGPDTPILSELVSKSVLYMMSSGLGFRGTVSGKNYLENRGVLLLPESTPQA